MHTFFRCRWVCDQHGVHCLPEFGQGINLVELPAMFLDLFCLFFLSINTSPIFHSRRSLSVLFCRTWSVEYNLVLGQYYWAVTHLEECTQNSCFTHVFISQCCAVFPQLITHQIMHSFSLTLDSLVFTKKSHLSLVSMNFQYMHVTSRGAWTELTWNEDDMLWFEIWKPCQTFETLLPQLFQEQKKWSIIFVTVHSPQIVCIKASFCDGAGFHFVAPLQSQSVLMLAGFLWGLVQ